MLPLFLDIDRVLRTHLSLIERYGGEEGVRDIGLLHSAIIREIARKGGDARFEKVERGKFCLV